MFGLSLLKATNLFSLPVCSMSVENFYGVWLSMDLSGIELWNFQNHWWLPLLCSVFLSLGIFSGWTKLDMGKVK